MNIQVDEAIAVTKHLMRLLNAAKADGDLALALRLQGDLHPA
jgi:hypothetical protein